MSAQDRLLQVAKAEVGYLEKATNAMLDDKTANAGKNNWTKYARDLDQLGFYNGKKNGYAWCCVFVHWCFYTAFGLNAALSMTFQGLGGLGAGVKYCAQYYQAKGRFVTSNPEPGDQIFFKDTSGNWSHTGIVVKVEGNTVYTIEGNTSGASGVIPNGGGVVQKSYPMTYHLVAGYGKPDWSKAQAEEGKTSAEPWYKEDAEWVKKMGIADGTRGGEPATRGEVWAMLHRLYDKVK